MIGPKDIEAKILNKQRNMPMPRSLHGVLIVGWGTALTALAMGLPNQTFGWGVVYAALMGFCASYIAGSVYGIVRHRALVEHYEAERAARVSLIKEAKNHA